MLKIAQQREEIYDYFHQSTTCKQFFFAAAQEERYAAYYTSMYLLQDTTDSLMAHRAKDFSSDPLTAYIEFWGVMQALFIQQDSIKELHEAITGSKLQTDNLISWRLMRDARNICAGHPANQGALKSRTFMGRGFGGYSAITYEQRQRGSSISHPSIDLGILIDSYVIEAADQLAKVLQSMKQQWP